MAKPNDPVATAQVADLFRQAEMVDDALDLYKKAIELRPPIRSIANISESTFIVSNVPTKPRRPGARSLWTEQERQEFDAAGRGAGRIWLCQRSDRALTDAVALERDNFSLRLTLANYANRIERYDEAETQLDAAAKLSERDEEEERRR